MDVIQIQRILGSHRLEWADLTTFCSEVIYLGVKNGDWNLCCISYDETFGFSTLGCQSREVPEGIWYSFPGGLLNILVQRRYHRRRFFTSALGHEALATGRWLHGPRALKASGVYTRDAQAK